MITKYPDFPVVTTLRSMVSPDSFVTDGYCDYIQESITEHIEKGHYTLEHAMKLTTGSLYEGNNGD
jgi:hypothetical protein